MSIYKQSDPDNIRSLQQVRDYIAHINKTIQNVFNSLDPDDNFTAAELDKYNEIRSNISAMELTVKGFRTFYSDFEKKVSSEISVQQDAIKLKVRKDNLLNELNVEPDAIRINGNRIEITTDNFILNSTQAFVKGKATAEGGNIAGWTIEKKASGTGHNWKGGRGSRIDVGSIYADYGSAGTIEATGTVNINATLQGNFDGIDCEGAVFHGGLSCSCMVGMNNNTLYAGTLQCYTTYREPGSSTPSSPTHPDSGYDNLDRYNENEMPAGGIITDQTSTKQYYSKLAGITWSDRRMKKDIRDVPVKYSYALLKKIRPVTFSWIDDGRKTTGYIAQEMPEAYRTEIQGKLGLKYNSIRCTLDPALIDMTRRLNEALYG